MKKLLLVVLSGMLFLAFTAAPTVVDAKPKTSYKSPSKSYTPTTPKSGDVSNSNSGATTKTPGQTTTGAKTGGFFGGGSFMKGMLVGGLAGMLFGGMFGSMGMLGNLLGLLINVFAIVAIFILLRNVIGYFMQKRKTNQKRY
ncbi:hypothetical protein [Paenibacillus cymbidii]|uniref:hypothetical protein n=1 Tax=Paenibacillus cymbidii TaxID=1639034 RepID=UPI001081C8BA|nr:hypothetical protein [Paenibacillus cymbidii]